MQLEMAVLADYANATKEGKLNIMGIFNEMRATSFPVAQPTMHLVLRFSAHRSEFGRPQQILVRLVDEDGRGELFRLDGEVTVSEANVTSPAFFDQSLRMNNIVFPRAGTYSFEILINNSYAKSVTLNLREVQNPPQQQLNQGA